MHTIVLLYMGDETITASAGTERVLTNMANALAKRGNHVIVITNDDENAVPYFLFDAEVELVFLNLWKTKIPFYVKIKREINRIVPIMDRPMEAYRAALSAKKLMHRFKDRRVDCIIAYNHEAIQVADRWQHGQVPIIAMMHNAIRIIMGKSNQASLREKEKADVIQVLMPSYIQEAKQYIRNTPIVYIPNVVEQIPAERQAQLDGTKDTYKIITVGRIDPYQKQTHILIEAFALLAERYPKWQVELWGEIKKQDYYEHICQFVKEHHLTKRIHLMGTTPNVQEQLQQADIFAFPSSFEGFPLALTEAMATGLPSVGFRSADAVKDLIVNGHNGILCEDGVSAFADGLERLMQNQSLRVKMGRQAVQDMKAYEPEHIWDQWQRLIESEIKKSMDKRR